MAGSGSGPGKRSGASRHRAPVRLHTWPRRTAGVPAEGTVVFDHIGLAQDPRPCADLLAAHTDPTRSAHPQGGPTTLLRVCVTAKYLARGDHARMVTKLPQTESLAIDLVPARLHTLLDAVTEPDLRAAVAATRKLVDLAAAQATSPSPDTERHA
jgi:hypothetical protein